MIARMAKTLWTNRYMIIIGFLLGIILIFLFLIFKLWSPVGVGYLGVLITLVTAILGVLNIGKKVRIATTCAFVVLAVGCIVFGMLYTGSNPENGGESPSPATEDSLSPSPTPELVSDRTPNPSETTEKNSFLTTEELANDLDDLI